MRTPSVETLASVFEDPKQAKAILQMNRAELETKADALGIPADRVYNRRELRMACLNAIDPGLFGEECIVSISGHFSAYYLNAGDIYNPTLIFWNGLYRVQDLDSFIKSQERRSIKFN